MAALSEQDKYYVATFGCRVNQADSAGLAGDLALGGMVKTEDQMAADVVVLNTCTVTHRSDADVRKAVHRLQRCNPDARIIVTGCFAQRDPDALVDLGGVSAVVGNAHKARLPIIADELLRAPKPAQTLVVHTSMDGVDATTLPPVRPHATVADKTRPFIKIQDGCDAVCSYCIIPAVRGRARSAAPDDVIDTVRKLVAKGYFEIVLTGVHLGTYGQQLEGQPTLAGLVRRILSEPGIGRLRLSCIEPMAFPLAVADLAAEDRRLAPHFHLPLQAGSDRILKRMVRPYRARDYVEMMQGIRARVPHACLGTDVIVGFPGETDDEFEETIRAVRAAGLNYVHVFSYSDRSGTASTRLDGKVDPRIIKERSNALHEVGREIWTAYLEAQVGQELDAVTLERSSRNPLLVRALTDNYCRVELPGPLEPNQPVRVRISRRDDRALIGEVTRSLGWRPALRGLVIDDRRDSPSPA